MQPIVLIGPAGAGKSTVGAILGELVGRPFVDLDAVGVRYYDEVGQPVGALVERIEVEGFRRAHRWWQPARVAALRAVTDFPDAVIALGAGHSHFEDETYAAVARRTLSRAFVVLLLPSRDPAESVSVLRERCVRDKGTDWVRDGDDLLDEWTRSDQHDALADLVVVGDGRPPADIAHDIAAHLDG